MSNYSERKLQQALHEARFYTQKAPSSGHGILDPETGEYIDQADIIAIRSMGNMAANVKGPEATFIEEFDVKQVLIIEEKHRKPPTCQIKAGEKQMLERIEEITGGRGLIAVKWKHTQRDHQFYSLDQLIDTGKHWKITDEISGMGLDELLS